MISQRLKRTIVYCSILGIFLFSPGLTFAKSSSQLKILPSPTVKIEQMENVPVKNDFSIGPTKISYTLKPGEEKTATLQITSRIEVETEFEVGVEDFTSQEDPLKYTKFLGDEKSQFSSKEWFTPAVSKFSLKHGERIYLPVKIVVPKNAEPGDHYTAVFIKTVPKANSATGFTLSSRIGSLFLIRTGDGEVKTQGEFTTFKINKKLFFSVPVVFELNFDNTGDIHLTPMGKIIITNLFGKKVDQVNVNEWVVLRNSKRAQTASWRPIFALGKYTATAQISRGYDNLRDSKTVTFYVIPVKLIGFFLGGLISILVLIKFLSSKLDIKLKKKDKKTNQYERIIIH
jgi:hypothetical protein